MVEDSLEGRTQFLPFLTDDGWKDMVRQLAHEIRNPLATILSAAQLLEFTGELTAEGRECVGHIREAVARIDRLLKDLRTLIHLSVGNPQTLEVAQVLRQTAARWQEAAKRKGVSLAALGSAPAKVFVDPDNLDLALDELVENALAHTPAGGDVALLAEVSDLFVALHVDDAGPGVDPVVMEKLARPFFSTSSRGTGLGLTKASLICRLAGGTLTWRNLAGKGARFSLVLPRVEP